MDDLERTIADLVERKRSAELSGDAEWRLANNALIALRYSVDGAGDLIEDLDPDAWATYRRPGVVVEQQPKVLPFRRAGNRKKRKRSDR